MSPLCIRFIFFFDFPHWSFMHIERSAKKEKMQIKEGKAHPQDAEGYRGEYIS